MGLEFIELTTEAIALIKSDQQLLYKVRQAIKTGDGQFISESNLYKTMKKNSTRLTEVAVLNAIVEHTGLPLSEIITGGKLSKLLSK